MRWLWLILISCSLHAQNCNILIDQTLGQPIYPFDEGPSGLYTFLNILQPFDSTDKTGLVIPVTQNLDSAIANPKNKLLVLTPTINRSYSVSTIQNIQKFVKEGGNLLVFGEHENYYNNSVELNRICSEFGITILSNAYKKGEGITGGWVKVNCPQYKLKGIDFYLPATLKLSGTAKVLAKADTAIVAATALYGKGKVVVMADYEIAWNFALKKNPVNHTFLLKSISWLAGFPIEKYYNVIPTYVFNNKGQQVVTSGWRIADLVTSSILSKLPNDSTYIDMLGPLPANYFPHTGANKTIIVGDGNSDYMHMLTYAGGQPILDAIGYKPYELPINSIAKEFGLRFSSQTLTNKCINGYNITLQPTDQKASCVSFIDTLDSRKFTVFYTADAMALDYNGPLGADDFSADTCLQLPAGYLPEKKIVGLYNKQVFAISDMETFLNMGNNVYLKKAFNDWLQQ